MSPRMTCLYRYNAELLKARSLKAVLVGELCQTAYERLEVSSSFTRREQQSMRVFTDHLRSCIKRVTSECVYHSRIVWPREGTNSLFVEDHALISRQCRRLLQGELKSTFCFEFILVCRLCQAAYELLDWTAPLSRRQQRSIHRFTINLRSSINRVTHRDIRQSSDVWSREETSSLSSDAQQNEEYKASKGYTRIRRR